MYGLYPLMHTEYIVPNAGGNEKYNTLVKVLTSKITELKKLQEARMQAEETTYI